VLVVILAIGCVALWFPVRKRWRWLHFLPVYMVAATLLQLAVERYRWQMVPAYLLGIILTAVSIRNVRFARHPEKMADLEDRKWRRRGGAILAIPLLLIAATVPVLFPQFELPKPTGPYAVGLADYYLIDQTRPETFTEDPDDHREIAIRVWYPAVRPEQGEPVYYGERAHEKSRILTRHTPMPPFIFDSYELIAAHAYRNAAMPPGTEQFPVLIYNHAYWASYFQHTSLMEELASHGYVVASIAHAYETSYLIDSQGELRGFDPYNAEFRLRGEEREKALPLQRDMVATDELDELGRILRDITAVRPKGVESMGIWGDDISFVIDELTAMNAPTGPFAGRLDLDRVGVFGHSMGGGASAQACLQDDRCIAGINIDGLQVGDVLDHPLEKPFMYIHHDNPHASSKTPNRYFFEQAKADAYLLVISGTRHLDFSDMTLYGKYSIPRLTGMLGTLDGERSFRIQADYIMAFFNHYLKNQPTQLLNGPVDAYTEVEIRISKPTN